MGIFDKRVEELCRSHTPRQLAEKIVELELEDKRKRDALADYKELLGDFFDYYSPKGGVSEVPVGPFERAAKKCGMVLG